MIRTLTRVRGASALGATAPGQSGPFGQRPDPDVDEARDEDDVPDTEPYDGGRHEPAT